MRIAYLTTDEVNASLAGQFAALSGLDLFLVQPNGTAPVEGARAVIYDLDFLPSGHMAALARAVGIGGRSPAVAVHSFNLDEGLARRFQCAGVVVSRRLTAALFEQLRAILGAPQHDRLVAKDLQERATRPGKRKRLCTG